MDVAALRKQMPTTHDMTYLNTGWAGPSPVSVVEAIKGRLEYESYNGPTTPDVMESGKQIDLQTQEAVAGLLNVSSNEILLTANTTTGLNNVLNGLPWREGDEIITCSLGQGFLRNTKCRRKYKRLVNKRGLIHQIFYFVQGQRK